MPSDFSSPVSMADVRPPTPPSQPRRSIFANGDVPEPPTRGGGEGMDRRIKQSFWTPARIGMILGGLALVGLIGYALLSATGGPRLNVEQDRLTVATVESGPFQEYVTESGTVVPRTTVYLDAIEGGRVEEVFVREGVMVQAGQPLLRLSSNDLQLRLISADAQRIEQIDRLQETRFRMEQSALDLRQQLAQMDYDIRRLERQYDRHEELFEKALLSAEEFENTQDELEYVQRNRELTLAGYRSDSLRNAAQISQMQNNVTRMEANYEVIERILDNLTVRAPVTGFLTSLDAEIGELRGSGDRFGQIDVTDGFRVEARIDEFYINRVQRDQQAVTLPIGGQEYQMVATKVYPEVREGRFTVDLEFTGEAPPDIRRGQTIRFRLELGDLEEALLIPRGGFYQSTGGNAIFVLDDDGSTARLQPIRVGRQNDRHYEVLEGLTPGDRVIVNSYDTYGDTETLVLK